MRVRLPVFSIVFNSLPAWLNLYFVYFPQTGQLIGRALLVHLTDFCTSSLQSLILLHWHCPSFFLLDSVYVCAVPYFVEIHELEIEFLCQISNNVLQNNGFSFAKPFINPWRLCFYLHLCLSPNQLVKVQLKLLPYNWSVSKIVLSWQHIFRQLRAKGIDGFVFVRLVREHCVEPLFKFLDGF